MSRRFVSRLGLIVSSVLSVEMCRPTSMPGAATDLAQWEWNLQCAARSRRSLNERPN